MGLEIGRRPFLKIMVAAGAATAGATPELIPGFAADQAHDLGYIPGAGVVGIVRASDAEHLILQTVSGELSIVAKQGARMYSGAFGDVKSTQEFLVGDRLAASGERQGSTIHATAIGSIFSPVDAEVTGVTGDGSVADTTAGPIELIAGRLPDSTEFAQPRVRNTTIKPGTIIRGLIWQHPATGDRYLMVRDLVS